MKESKSAFSSVATSAISRDPQPPSPLHTHTTSRRLLPSLSSSPSPCFSIRLSTLLPLPRFPLHQGLRLNVRCEIACGFFFFFFSFSRLRRRFVFMSRNRRGCYSGNEIFLWLIKSDYEVCILPSHENSIFFTETRKNEIDRDRLIGR